MESSQNDQKKNQNESKTQAPPVKTPPKIVSLMEDERVLATISYVPMGFLLTLLTQPQNEKLKFHAKQGIVFFLGWIIILVIIAMLPMLGILAFMLYFAINVIVLYRTYAGETWKMPVVGDFADKIKVDLPTAGGEKPSPENNQPQNPAPQNQPEEQKHETEEKKEK